jgi:hypothetical protein
MLLEVLLNNNMTLGESIDHVMESVGPDPYYKTELSFYPSTMEDYLIQ